MSEDIEPETGTPEVSTETQDSGYGDILKGDGVTPQDDSSVQPEVQEPEAGQQLETTDPEIVLREGLKAKLSEIEEWQKGYLRQKDYTQKTQEIAQQRKSFEQAFGKLPQSQELANLGKLYQQYFKSPDVKAAIDAVLAGKNLREIFAGDNQTPKQPQDVYVQTLEAKIQELESKLDHFSTSFEEREQERGVSEAQKVFESWKADKKSKANVDVTEEIDAEMAYFIPSIKQKHPDWDANKILDEAYRHATIDQQGQRIASQVVQNAETLKTKPAPKINSKAPLIPEDKKGYAEIFLNR